MINFEKNAIFPREKSQILDLNWLTVETTTVVN